MKRIASFIIKCRYINFLLFAVAAVFCVLSMGKVKVNNDLKTFLPEDTETRRGLVVMQDEFVTYASTSFMVKDVAYEDALLLADKMKDIEHVTSVGFDGTADHYKDGSALINVSFDFLDSDPNVNAAADEVKNVLKDYESYSYGFALYANYSEQLASEMVSVVLLSAIVIIIVLLITSRSYFEIPIFLIVFFFAALLNMGTNYWLGEISAITQSIAVILQLALAIDYAIIFAHRYQDETEKTSDDREALTNALAKSITEITSSSLTTISGLAALTLMQFSLGYDLGVVLSKGIIFSMLTVFLLMPGLISLFPKLLSKTAHRQLLPNITRWGRFLTKSKFCFVIVFTLLLPFAVYFSSNTNYAFADHSIDELIPSERRTAIHIIDETFSPATAVALIVPKGDYAVEQSVIKDISEINDIKQVIGLASVEIAPGIALGDTCDPAGFSQLLDIDIEQAKLLYKAYGLEHGKLQYLYDDTDGYNVPLIDMFLYMFDLIDRGTVELTQEQNERLSEQRGTLERAAEQLLGSEHNRILITTSLPVESEQSVALAEQIRGIAGKYYPEDEFLVIGDITAANDLKTSYTGDSRLISMLTILFVFIILLFTFKSPVIAAILVFVIQGSIWINFSFPYIFDVTASFVTNMIVTAIQMGATIDYAIVVMSRYTDLRKRFDKKEAMALAVNESFPTVITSGTIMTVAGVLIALRVSDVYVGHIGLAVGRGALISVILVMTVLPQLILLLDTLITKTTIKLRFLSKNNNK